MSSPDINLGGPSDPFAQNAEEAGGAASAYVHIRNQQRNGRKSLTTIQGVSTQFDYKRLLKAFKKHFSCNGTIVEDPEMGCIIQVQGDHRVKIAEFLVSEGIVEKENLKIHGA